VQIVEKGAPSRIFVPEQAGKSKNVGLVPGQENVLILWWCAQACLPELVAIGEYIAGKIALAERPSIYRAPARSMKLGDGVAIIKCRFLDLHEPVFPDTGST